MVLDALEKAASESIDLRELRPRIEHAQIMREDDVERVGRLGGVLRCFVLMLRSILMSFSVIASIQPTHVTDDMWYGEMRLGPDQVCTPSAQSRTLEPGLHLGQISQSKVSIL